MDYGKSRYPLAKPDTNAASLIIIRLKILSSDLIIPKIFLVYEGINPYYKKSRVSQFICPSVRHNPCSNQIGKQMQENIN